MLEPERSEPRPTPLSSWPAIAPAPRLAAPPVPEPAPLTLPPPAPLPPELQAGAAPVQPPPAAPPVAARQARASRPGEIVLAATRMGLGQLFRLEQDLAQLPGVGQPSIDVLDDGQVVISFAPGAEERVRQYLALAGIVNE